MLRASEQSTNDTERSQRELSFDRAKHLMDSLMDNPKLLYVICPFNIGDFLVNGGLCYALQIKKRKTSCALIVCDKFKISNIDFVGVAQILYISQENMDVIREYILFSSVYETERYIYGHFHVQNNQFDWNSELSFFDRYRENVFGLPLETEILPPLIKDISLEHKQKLHALYQISNRTIILTPYANSGPQLFSDDVWVEITKRLRQQGYIVYTNVAGFKELPVQGTKPIRLTFSELYYVADKVKCFIGRRSGILDFLSFSDADILCVLYPDHWHDDLRSNFPDKKSYSFYFAGHYKEVILEYARENHIDDMDRIQISFPHVDASELYYEEGHLIDAIVNTAECL